MVIISPIQVKGLTLTTKEKKNKNLITMTKFQWALNDSQSLL